MSLSWGGYRNGQIPKSALAPIPATNGQYIKRQLLAPLQALRAAFKAHFGKSLDIVEAYRDLARQETLRYAWVHRYPGANNAAIPGTSLHGWALSVDFGSRVNLYGSAEKRWMDTNAPKYGFLPTGNGFSPREAWHFDGTGTVTASLGSTPIQKEIIDMATGMLHKAKGNATVYWQEKPATPLIGIDAATYSALKAVGIVIGTEITGAQLKQLIKDCGTATQPFGNAARGVAYRDESDGAIYAQTAPGGTLAHLSRAEWASQEQNGLQYVNTAHKDIVTLLATE